MEDKFKLYKKWFWIGIAVGFFNILAGLIYGIALTIEPEHRKEWFAIILWSFISFSILTSILKNIGMVP